MKHFYENRRRLGLGQKKHGCLFRASTSGEELKVYGISSAGISRLLILGRSTVQDGEISSLGDDGITITLSGKNLLDPSLFKESEGNGIKITVDKDDIYKSGTATKNFYLNVFSNGVGTPIKPPSAISDRELYIYPFGTRNSAQYGVYTVDENGAISFDRHYYFKEPCPFFVESTERIWLRVHFANGITYNSKINFMISKELYENPVFQPYAPPRSVTLPSYVKDRDGNEVKLRLASLDGECDTLNYDRVKGKIIYTRQVDISDTGELFLLDTPVLYDITTSELLKAFSELCLPSGYDGDISVLGNGLASGILCDYYSLTRESKYDVLINCTDENGSVLLSRSYSLRLGTLFSLSAPKIEGYVPIKQGIKGVSNYGKTFTLVYKKED